MKNKKEKKEEMSMNIFRRTKSHSLSGGEGRGEGLFKRGHAILFITALLLFLTCQLVAQGTPGLVFTQIPSQNAYEVRRGTADVPHIIIPATNPNTTTGWPVTQIAIDGFRNNTTMTEITIPGTVTIIGLSAFAQCSSLARVNFLSPINLTNISQNAFGACHSLTSFTIPSSVTSISGNPFSGSHNLANITVASGNTHFRSENNSVIRNMDNTLIIGTKNSIIPNDVRRIGTDAFRGNVLLTSITIPNSVGWIDRYAFGGCRNLASVTFGNGLTDIGGYAFDNTNLTNVTIPSSVTTMEWNPFTFCSNLANISVEPGNTHFRSENNSVIRNSDNTLVIGTKKSIIPNTVTSIGNYAFYGYGGLISIIIPNSVTMIGDEAFAHCSRLNSIYIPNSVANIGSRAFSSCLNLTIYAEATSQPIGWHANWNQHNRPVVWGHTLLNAPTNLAWSKVGNSLTMSWDEPAIPNIKSITHSTDDGGVAFTAIGSNAPVTISAFQRFTAAQLATKGVVAGTELTSISLLSGNVFWDTIFRIQVYTGGSGAPFSPGTLRVDVTRTNTHPNPILSNQWNEITLDFPLQITPSEELWIGYTVISSSGHPAGAVNDTMVNNFGNLLFVNGQWTTLYDEIGFTGNWGIKGIAETNGNSVSIANFDSFDTITTMPFDAEGDSFVSLQAVSVTSNARSLRNLTLTGYKVHWFYHNMNVRSVTNLNPNVRTHTHNNIPVGSWIYGVSAVYNTGESFISFFNDGAPIIFLEGLLVVNPNNHNFGQVDVGKVASRDFTITNNGDMDITISSIEIIGAGSCAFEIDLPETSIVPASGNLTFTLSFTPLESIEYIAEIAINSIEEHRLTIRGTGKTVSEYDPIEIPLVTSLIGNFPNPFNPETNISFQLSVDSYQGVRIEVFNIRGQRVRTLLDGSRAFESGRHTVTWDGRDDGGVQVSSGVYFYRMQAGEYQSVRRMLLLK